MIAGGINPAGSLYLLLLDYLKVEKKDKVPHEKYHLKIRTQKNDI